MVSVVDLAGLLVIIAVNSTAAALVTRFLRIHLATRWGSMLYVGLLVPLVLVVLTLVLGTTLGPDLQRRSTVVGLAILLPTAVGIAVDFFWMPAPEEIDLPERYEA